MLDRLAAGVRAAACRRTDNHRAVALLKCERKRFGRGERPTL